jgi:hypothetical protein
MGEMIVSGLENVHTAAVGRVSTWQTCGCLELPLLGFYQKSLFWEFQLYLLKTFPIAKSKWG